MRRSRFVQVEYYVDGVLGQAFSVGNLGSNAADARLLTGAWAAVGGAEVEAVHKLTLPL